MISKKSPYRVIIIRGMEELIYVSTKNHDSLPLI
jgi:hypothetical protein